MYAEEKHVPGEEKTTVRLRGRGATLLFALALACNLSGPWAELASAQTQVSYQTEDGWTIVGTLFLPQGDTTARMPAVILLPEPGWIDRSTFEGYLVDKLAKSGIAALSIDFRGTGSSLGKKDFEAFSSKERDGFQWDIRGAVKFLSSQKNIDPRRIAIVASGLAGNYAVLEASENPALRAVVMMSGSLTPAAREQIQFRKDIPVLGVAWKKDRKSFQEMAEAYSLSENENSDLLFGIGHGTVMFSHTVGLEEQVAGWLDKNLMGLGAQTEVSFKSEDGWTLHGTLHLPDRVKANSTVAGVVLVHGAKHDQQTYYHMAPELVKRGIAALRFDWRGKGQSVAPGKEKGGADSSETNEKVYLDVKAAIAFLASQKGIDPSRIGLVAATLGTNHTLRAALGDSRIKTVVLLTSNNVPKGEAMQFLTTSDTPILAIASLEDLNYNSGSLAEATRQAYGMSKSKGSEILLYDDAGRGSEMFKAKPELQGIVLRWLEEKLAGAELGKSASR